MNIHVSGLACPIDHNYRRMHQHYKGHGVCSSERRIVKSKVDRVLCSYVHHFLQSTLRKFCVDLTNRSAFIYWCTSATKWGAKKMFRCNFISATLIRVCTAQ